MQVGVPEEGRNTKCRGSRFKARLLAKGFTQL